jgi:ubiquinone/menaquinone biosynthesis C-methylase UbiE
VSPDFDFEATFNDDYSYFYGPHLTDELNRSDAAVVWSRLELRPDERVLDAPCGHGRIANLLAVEGCAVVGVDATELFLERARADAKTLGVDVDYRHGDLRALPVADAEMDAVLSWFTSFGYFGDADNQAVLREYARVMKPGGRLLIEMLNRDDIVRRHVSAPFAQVARVGEDLLLDQSSFDPIAGRMETDRTVVRDGRVSHSHHFVRLLAVTEWILWLADAGFVDPRFVGHGGEPLTLTTGRLVVLASRDR